MNKLLVHACCAPCLAAIYENIASNLAEYGLNSDTDFDICWYNPNIQPLAEYNLRKETLKNFLNSKNKEGIFLEQYDLLDFTKHVSNLASNFSCRCEYCYEIRLRKIFEYAKLNNYTHVTTSLLISPYQKHDLIIKVCERLSEEYDINFSYKDYRPMFYIGKNTARQMGLYMQKYCGCVYSIDEAYLQAQKRNCKK